MSATVVISKLADAGHTVSESGGRLRIAPKPDPILLAQARAWRDDILDVVADYEFNERVGILMDSGLPEAEAVAEASRQRDVASLLAKCNPDFIQAFRLAESAGFILQTLQVDKETV